MIKNFRLTPGTCMCCKCLDSGRVPNGDQKWDLPPCPDCERGKECEHDPIMFVPHEDTSPEWKGATYRIYLPTESVKAFVRKQLLEIKVG